MHHENRIKISIIVLFLILFSVVVLTAFLKVHIVLKLFTLLVFFSLGFIFLYKTALKQATDYKKQIKILKHSLEEKQELAIYERKQEEENNGYHHGGHDPDRRGLASRGAVSLLWRRGLCLRGRASAGKRASGFPYSVRCGTVCTATETPKEQTRPPCKER